MRTRLLDYLWHLLQKKCNTVWNFDTHTTNAIQNKRTFGCTFKDAAASSQGKKLWKFLFTRAISTATWLQPTPAALVQTWKNVFTIILRLVEVSCFYNQNFCLTTKILHTYCESYSSVFLARVLAKALNLVFFSCSPSLWVLYCPVYPNFSDFSIFFWFWSFELLFWSFLIDLIIENIHLFSSRPSESSKTAILDCLFCLKDSF